jgi:hypothetical protein
MRILLIATNRHQRLMSRMNARPAPIGLAYIAGYLDPQRHEIEVLDLMFSDDYLEETEAKIREFQPDLVGLSLRNLDNSSYMDSEWWLPSTKSVVDRVRSVTEAPIVCGGPGFSLLPRECFNFLEPDFGVAGDGGETFAQLVNCLESGEDYANSPGLLYRDSGGGLVYGGLAYSSFNVSPRLDELDMARYDREGFGIGIVTKLDDSFSHSMPAHGNVNWRVLRPVEEVVDEVHSMKERYGVKKVFFIDSGFNVPLPHAKALCQSLIEADLNVHWNSYLAPVPDACDEEVLNLMKQAGSALVIMKGLGGPGLEEQSIQTSLAPLEQVCHRCDDADMHYVISQYFGEPGETPETVETKLNFLKDINPALANLRVGVRVRPHTSVAQAALQEGLINDESELIRPTFYIAEPVREWIVDRLKAEAEANPRWNLL